MLQELFDNERRYIAYFFEKIDVEKASKIFDVLKNCSGTLFFTGVGKSGIVAEKIAATMTSTGTRALFLSSQNALHGDIGIVNENDVFVMFSKSGESEELLQLVPFLRNRNVTIISLCCNGDSRLAQASNLNLVLPLEKELCPFGMAPTTSTTIQMIFGDIMTVALMREKGFSLAEYALNHPSGDIGKRVSLKVQDIMVKGNNIPICFGKDKLIDTLVELSNKQCGCVIITDDAGKMLGIFTDGDLRRTLQSHGPKALEMTMDALMIKNPKHTEPDALAHEAIKIMEANQKSPIMVLPVVNQEKKVTGLIKMHDLIQSGL